MANNSSPRTEPKEIMGLHRITKKRLLELCKKDKLYQTPSLNDVLYLHYQGFQCIEGLEDYTELKCLWLECNAISQIQGLDNQTKLKCLFLQSNLIKKIENLEFCKELDTINLSQNHIRKIENVGVDVLPVLNTLNLSSNYLNDCAGLRELENCRNVSVLDLSNNRIDDILVVKIFSKMPELKVLVLQGNPVVSKIPQYRKTLILECKNLTYLDSRPVFPKDRACAEAWKRGGYQEERKESERWNQKERRKMRDSVNATIRMRNKFRKPEDHLSLLVSSDSEDDTSKKKRSRQQQVLDAGVDMEMGIWDEVAGGDTKSETASSSDMNVSSSTSTTDSNEQSSSYNSKCDETQDICNNINGDEKILNVNTRESLIKQSQKVEKVKEPGREDISKYNSKMEDSKVGETEVDTKEKDVRNTMIELRGKPNIKHNASDEGYLQNSYDNLAVPEDEDQAPYEKHTTGKKGSADTTPAGDEDGTLYEKHKTAKRDSIMSDQIISDNCGSPKDSFNDTIKAIHRATLNDLSQTPAIPERVNLKIETNEDHYEPISEMEEAMKTMTKQEDVDGDKARELNSENEQKHTSAKTHTQIEYDNECSLVTNQMKKDFEQISSNMDLFMVQLQRDQEGSNDALAALFTENETTTEISSDSSGNEAEADVAWSLYRMVDQWDIDTKIKENTAMLLGDTSGGRLVSSSEEHGKENANGDIDSPGKQAKHGNRKSGSYTQILTPESNGSFNEFEKELEKKETISSCNNKAEHDWDMGAPEVYPNGATEKTILDTWENPEHEEIDILTAAYDMKDLGGYFKDKFKCDKKQAERQCESKMTDQSVSLERGRFTNTLDRDDNFEYKPLDISVLTRASNQALTSFEKEAKELKDLLVKLENENDQLFRKPNAETKCADESAEGFSEEDLNESLKITPRQENISKQNTNESHQEKEQICDEILGYIIESLDLRTVKPKNYDFPNSECDDDCSDSQTENAVADTKLPLANTIRGVIDSITEIFKNKSQPMHKQRCLATASSEISASLKNVVAQPNLNTFNKDTHQSLDNLLDEYQKEQSLEIQQMVDRVYAQKDRYNDTIELIDGKLMVIDKDTGELKELPKPTNCASNSDEDYDTAQSEDEAACSNLPRLRNRPTARRSNEHLIHQALVERCQRNYTEYEEDSDNEEFYSMDPLMKPNVYGKIDREFFDKLSLDHLNFSQQDEDHIVQCARSYEELKSVLSLSKHERCVTVEEHDLLQKMTERKLHKLEGYNEEPTRDENELLRKMRSKTKTWDWMKSSQSEGEIGRMTHWPTKNEPIQILEYNIETSKDLHYSPGEYQIPSDTMEICGNDVYNFTYDNTVAVNKDLEEINSSRDEATRTFNHIFKRIDGQEKSNNVGAEKSAEALRTVAKFSEEEKNEIENNTDVDGIIKKLELQFESGRVDQLKAASEVSETLPEEKFKFMSENINQTTDKLPCDDSAESNDMFPRSDSSLKTKYEFEKRSQLSPPSIAVIENPMISLNSKNDGYPNANKNSEDPSVHCGLSEITSKTHSTVELLQKKQFPIALHENDGISGNSKFVDSNILASIQFDEGYLQESVYSDQPLDAEYSPLPDYTKMQFCKDLATKIKTYDSQEYLSPELSTSELTQGYNLCPPTVLPDSILQNALNILQKSQYLTTTSSIRKGSGCENLEEYKSQKHPSSNLLQKEPQPSSELKNSMNDDSCPNFLDTIGFFNSDQLREINTITDQTMSQTLPDPELRPEKHFPSVSQCFTHREFREEKHFPVNELKSVHTNSDGGLGAVQKSGLSYDNPNFRQPRNTVVSQTGYNLKSSSDQHSDTEHLPFRPDIDILECNLEILDCNEDVIDTITVNAELHYEFENL